MWPLERGTLDSDNVYYRINEDGVLEISPFQSIVHCFWWSIATLTTTGYGDIVPVTPFGKFVAGLTMLCGIMVIALPTSILGSNLVTEWALHQRLQFQMQAKKRIQQDLKGFERNKTKRLNALQLNNELMLQAIAEIQDRLADFNPPKYYLKYRDLKSTYLKACGRIHELEDKVERYKRINKNLTRFNDFSFMQPRRNGKNDDDEGGDNNGISVNSIKLRKWKRSRTDDTRNSADEMKPFPLKGLKTSPINTLRKIGRPFTRTLSRDNSNVKSPSRAGLSKENISSPTELRIGYTPIIDERHEHGTPMVRSGSEPLDVHSTPNFHDTLLAKNLENKRNKIVNDSNSTHPISAGDDVRGRGGEQREISMVDGDERSANREKLEINDGEEGEIEIIVGNPPPTEHVKKH